MASRRIAITRHGGPNVLEVITDSKIPEPGPGEVRIRIETAGVAFADVMMREGIYPGAPKPPFTPGYDMVGLVDSVGADANKLEPGTRVAALTKVGAYADWIVLPERGLVPVPDRVDPAEAVCLVLNYLTGLQMIERMAHLRKGDTALIHGASGGVGTAMLELCRLAGIMAIGTASAGKHDVVSRLGGTPIDYNHEDFVVRTLEMTEGRGVDAAFDPIGGSYWKRSYDCLGTGGCLVAYGYYGLTSGGRKNVFNMIKPLITVPGFKPPPMIGKCSSVSGYSVTGMKARRPDWYRGDLGRLLALLADRELKPIVARKFPLESAADAHTMMGERSFTGKLVLTKGGRG